MSESTVTQQQQQQQQQAKPVFSRSTTLPPQSFNSRPDDLQVTPWYLEEQSLETPPPTSSWNVSVDQSSCLKYPSIVKDSRYPDLVSTRNSSIESEYPPRSSLPRKAYMNLSDAIALLDETCPNPDASPSLTPRTPRTPLAPYSKNKRARSKSSDNSSNYSNDRLSDKSLELAKAQEKERKRPFLKKIGISKTEDRPFFSKLAPKIIGKPYLEKIGPSKAVEKPFLEKIGSSKTIDKFTFDTPPIERKKESTVNVKNILGIERVKKSVKDRRDEIRGFSTGERRRSGKGFLLKMHSFETEDLEESTAMKVPHRGPLRGASLDDVLDSGPGSMPHIDEIVTTDSSFDSKGTSDAELVRCRVTTSEEIVLSNSCLNSSMEVLSFERSPKRRGVLTKKAGIPPSRRAMPSSYYDDGSTPSSAVNINDSLPSPDDYTSSCKELQNGRQTSEDTLDKRKNRHEQFERKGISSDNLNLSNEPVAPTVFAKVLLKKNLQGTCSEDRLNASSSRSVGSLTSNFKQLQEKFELQSITTESYADFKTRPQGYYQPNNALRRFIVREKTIAPCYDISKSLRNVTEGKPGSSPKVRSKSAEHDRKSNTRVESQTSSDSQGQRLRNRSVLRKQAGVDHPTELELDLNPSARRPKRQMPHEYSQETIDLLTELRKVKSLLRTPSVEKENVFDTTKEPVKFPKKILLTDREFCLSVERENSVRSSMRTKSDSYAKEGDVLAKKLIQGPSLHTKVTKEVQGSSFFDKTCQSLDYADDVKTEARVVSLSSPQSPPAVLHKSTLDSREKSIDSDVFDTPTKKPGEHVEVIVKERKMEDEEQRLDGKESRNNHCPETDIAITVDQKGSSKKATPVQARTSDIYEIISPKATPFRMKKRLGRISVEDTVKQESFTLTKVESKTVTRQKRAKCFPL